MQIHLKLERNAGSVSKPNVNKAFLLKKGGFWLCLIGEMIVHLGSFGIIDRTEGKFIAEIR